MVCQGPRGCDWGGAIISSVSTHAFGFTLDCFPYPVAKDGLIALTRAFATESASRGVRNNAIFPAYVVTPSLYNLFESFPDLDAERVWAAERHPIGRIGRADGFGGPAVFLASADASFISARCSRSMVASVPSRTGMAHPSSPARG